jgi:hypothetical protein
MMIEPSSTCLFRKKASVRWVHRSRRSPQRTRRQIKRRLLADALGKDGCLRYVGVKPSIFLEDVLEISQDFEHHAHLGFDVTVISIRERPGLWVLCKRTSPKGRMVKLNTRNSK